MTTTRQKQTAVEAACARAVFEDTLLYVSSLWHRQVTCDVESDRLLVTVTHSKLMLGWADHEKEAALSQVEDICTRSLKWLDTSGYDVAVVRQPYIRGGYKEDAKGIARLAVSVGIFVSKRESVGK